MLEFFSSEDGALVLALLAWGMSYGWLRKLGVDCLSKALDVVVGLIPATALGALAIAVAIEWIQDRWSTLFWVWGGALLTLLLLTMSGKVSLRPTDAGWKEAFKNFGVATLGASAGVAGAWAGYQFAYGTRSVAWWFSLVAIVGGLAAYKLNVTEACSDGSSAGR